MSAQFGKQPTADSGDAGRVCPYCRFPLKEGLPIVRCEQCHAAHHTDCWEENAGCAVIACTGGGAGRRTVGAVVTPAIDQAAHRVHDLESNAIAVPTHSPPVAVPQHGRRGPSLAIAIVLLACVIGGSTAAIIFSRQGNRDAPDTIATIQRSGAKASRVANATSAPRTVIRTVTAPATASSAPEHWPMSWPAGFDGYTVALASDRLRSDALGAASKASAAGLGDVGVVWSSDYSSLRPGYWFVWSGIYTTAGEAEVDVAQAEDAGFAGAYVRRVAR